VRFWDTLTGQQVAVLDGEPPPCHKLLVSPDGRWLLCVERRRWTVADTVCLRDAHTGSALARIELKSPDGGAWCFAPVSSAGGLLACAESTPEGGRVRLLDLPSLRTAISLPDAYGPLAFSADGQFLATGTSDGAAVWEVGTGRRVVQIEDSPANRSARTLALSKTGDRLAVYWRSARQVGLRGPDAVQVRDVLGGTVGVDRPLAWLLGVAASDSVLLWEGIPPPLFGCPTSDYGLRAFDMASGAERYSTKCAAYLGFIDEVRASLGDRWVAVSEMYTSPLVDVWDSLKVRLFGIRSIGIGSFGLGRPSVGVYDVGTGRCCGRVMDTHVFAQPILSPDGRILAVQREDSAIELLHGPPRKPVAWFLAAAGLLALPVAWLARRRARALRRRAEAAA
jgi:hypothetical protein